MSAAEDGAGKDLGARGSTRYSISRQMQKETCRHSAVTLTIADPQIVQPSARGSRLIVQRGIVMRFPSIGSCSMGTLSVPIFKI